MYVRYKMYNSVYINSFKSVSLINPQPFIFGLRNKDINKSIY